MSTAAQSVASPRGQSRLRRILTAFVVTIIVLTLTLYLGVSAYAANVLTTPYRNFGIETPARFDLAFEDVRFPARGGDVEIAGWFIPSEVTQRVVILVHGKDGNRSSEFQDNFVDLAAALHERGFSVLMIDMRGHGKSGDAHFSFGLNERRDIEGAVDWLKGRGFQPAGIGLLGVSMGAASSIGAAADNPDIHALVADCSYADIAPIIEQQWAATSGLPDFFLPSTILMGRLLLGYDLSASRPVDEIGRIAPRPALIIHGTGDQLIPSDHADQLQAAYSSAELWKVPDADHAGSYLKNRQDYVTRVTDFFDQHLQ